MDYVAVFDPVTETFTKLKRVNFKYPRGLSVQGMDVIQSSLEETDTLIYLVNHRQPLDSSIYAEDVGQDSVVEIFKTRIGLDEMRYVATFKDPIIATPNDIVGSGDDMSFYFTNDHGSMKTGLARKFGLDRLLDRPWSNVAYCHASEGCKVAVDGLVGASGIVKGDDGIVYVASSTTGRIHALERQSDNSLVVTDILKTDRPLDTLSIDEDGAIWAAGLPKAQHLVDVHFQNPSIKSPSSAIRTSINTDQSRYYGEKYKIEKMFEDDGSVASGTTTVAYDPRRKRLFLHGIAAPHLTVCEL